MFYTCFFLFFKTEGFLEVKPKWLMQGGGSGGRGGGEVGFGGGGMRWEPTPSLPRLGACMTRGTPPRNCAAIGRFGAGTEGVAPYGGRGRGGPGVRSAGAGLIKCGAALAEG